MYQNISQVVENNYAKRLNKEELAKWVTLNDKKFYTSKVTRASIREVPLPGMLKPIIKGLVKNNMKNKLKYGELYLDNNLIFCKENCDYIDNIESIHDFFHPLFQT